MIIDLADRFSPYPSGRFKNDGTFNGERFREEILAPELRTAQASGDENAKVFVNIDGVRSFGSSFLEEAFAGLVRTGEFTKADLDKLLEIVCTKPHILFFKDAILGYIRDAAMNSSTQA